MENFNQSDQNISGNFSMNLNSALMSPNAFYIVALFLLGFWIIMTNCYVLHSIVCSRPRQFNLFHTQLLSLSFTDLFVGTASMTSSLIYSQKELFRSYKVCSSIILLLIMSEFLSICHVFAICLLRFITVSCMLKTKSAVQIHSSARKTVSMLAIFGIAFVLTIIPFAIYGDYETKLNGCTMDSVFGIAYIPATRLYTIVLLSPQGLINILYFMTYLRLRSSWKNVGVENQNVKMATMMSQKMGNTLHAASQNIKETHEQTDKVLTMCIKRKHKLAENHNHTSVDDGEKPSTSSCAKSFMTPEEHIGTSKSEDGNRNLKDNSLSSTILNSKCPRVIVKIFRKQENESEQSNEETHKENSNEGNPNLHNNEKNCKRDNLIEDLSDEKNETKVAERRVRDNSKEFNLGQGVNYIRNQNQEYTLRTQTGMNRDGQQKVLLTIGIILLVFNICFTPLNVLLIYEGTGHVVSRRVKMVVVVLTLINSGINPIIYACRIKGFRESWERVKQRFYILCCNCA